MASHHSSYSSSSTQTTLLLLATKKRPNNDNTRGFDPKRKYSIDDEKSYGGSKSNNGVGGKTLSDDDPSAAGMADFFAAYPEWEPLFRGILLHGGEGGGGSDDDDDDDYDGRVAGRHQNYDWETELFRTCWSELAHLTYQNVGDTGSLVLLPDIDGVFDGPPLGVVVDFVERNLIRPIRWLGRDGDWEIVAMERGGVAVRLLYKLGEIPDIERNGGVVGRPER